MFLRCNLTIAKVQPNVSYKKNVYFVLFLCNNFYTLTVKQLLRVAIRRLFFQIILFQNFLFLLKTGASSDMQQATKIARAMVTTYGMSEKVSILFSIDSLDTSL